MEPPRLSLATRREGYEATLEAERDRIGPLSIEAFEQRYAHPAPTPDFPQQDDPLNARFGEIFRTEPGYQLRQEIARVLEERLPQAPGPTFPDATLNTLLSRLEAHRTASRQYKEASRSKRSEARKRHQETEAEWEECLAQNRLLTMIAWWGDLEPAWFERLLGLRFETGKDLLEWLEGQEDLPFEPHRPLMRAEPETEEANDYVITHYRRERMNRLHSYLTGHFGIHLDFRLSESEHALLRRNGFVVTQRLGAESFGDLYYHLFNNDLPVCVTIDSLLHAWHHSYDAILKEVEVYALSATLNDILKAMHRRLPAAQEAYGDGILAESLRDADYYLAMALSLLHGSQTPTCFGQEARVASTLQACAAQQMQSFPLFDAPRNVDFSQFKPRGHYEKSLDLQRYFRAMMWVGRIDLRIAGSFPGPAEDTRRQLGTALILLDLLRRADQFAAWEQFDRLLQAFVGVTDSLTFARLDAFLQQAGITSPADIAVWSTLERLQEALLRSDAGVQQIASDPYQGDLSPTEPIVLPRSFTLMGQKFTLDSWALGQVVYDHIHWQGEKVMRRVPSCLDVAFSVLGNDAALPELVARLQDPEGHPFRDGLPYQHQLAALRDLLDSQDETVWSSSLYTQWLHCLRALSAPTTGPEYPAALRTPAWADKALNTQMASWTQLRHDTLLYTKQSYTFITGCSHPAGYVEPNPLFWERLERMAAYAADLLAQTPYPGSTPLPHPTSNPVVNTLDAEVSRRIAAIQTKQVTFLRRFAETVGRLRSISDKQSAKIERTEEERTFLLNIVQITRPAGSGAKRRYNGWYPALFYAGPEKCAEADMLVADVHTNPPSMEPPDPGCVLHQGVGGVDLLVLAAEEGDQRTVFAGPTLSHYEFEKEGCSRKSDEEWQTDLEVGHYPARPPWTRSYLAAAGHLPLLDIRPRPEA